MRIIFRGRSAIKILAALTAILPIQAADAGSGRPGQAARWVVSQKGTVLEIAYGSGTKTPQYGALHLESGYFRLVPGSDSHWGTSVVLLPSFWQGGVLYQGAPVTETHSTSDEGDLILDVKGRISSLDVEAEVRIIPPFRDLICAVVSAQVGGTIVPDKRPGEAFKIVTLSSMHVSSSQWDCREAWGGPKTLAIPVQGWIVWPAVPSADFGLLGGSSAWKKNAPTMSIRMDRDRQITGWVTKSTDPNDDNVGFWAASDTLVRSWRYLITARKG